MNRLAILFPALSPILFLAITFFPQGALCEVTDPVLVLPEGQVILSISATERQEVTQDLLVATLSYQASGGNPREVQNEVNASMKKALDLSEKVKEVKVNTGSYQVYEYTEPRTKEKKWRASQTMILKSTDAEQVLALVGKLQDIQLSLSGLSYMVSPERAVSVKDSLMEGALKTLEARATRAAKALGKSKASLKEVSVESENGYDAPRPMAAIAYRSAEADMAPPVAAAGESTITLTVSARAILAP